MPEAEIECSCLQRTQVEDNLINGINPLGRDSKQCYQLSSDMIYLYKSGIKDSKKNIIILMKTPDIIPRSTVWADYIKEFMTLDGKRTQEQDLEAVLNEAVEVEYMHEGRVNSLGKSSLYNREDGR